MVSNRYWSKIRHLDCKKNCSNTNNILIGGDFNCCDSENDRFSNKLDKSSKFFTNLKVIHNLSEVYRQCSPNKMEFAYNHQTITSRNSRIDFILQVIIYQGMPKLVLYYIHLLPTTKLFVQVLTQITENRKRVIGN